MAQLLSDQDAQRVEQVIHRVERHTAGEIVVVVAQRSAPYDDWRALLTAFLTFGTALALYLFVPSIPGSWVVAGQAPAAIVFWWLAGRAPLLRMIVPGDVMQDAVMARAQQLFIARGLTETQDRSGVLVLISAFEHCVEILADKGIHARAGVEEWTADVDLIVRAIRENRTADGLCEAIERIGQELAGSFPARPDGRDELPNAVIRL